MPSINVTLYVTVLDRLPEFSSSITGAQIMLIVIFHNDSGRHFKFSQHAVWALTLYSYVQQRLYLVWFHMPHTVIWPATNTHVIIMLMTVNDVRSII